MYDSLVFTPAHGNLARHVQFLQQGHVYTARLYQEGHLVSTVSSDVREHVFEAIEGWLN